MASVVGRKYAELDERNEIQSDLKNNDEVQEFQPTEAKPRMISLFNRLFPNSTYGLIIVAISGLLTSLSGPGSTFCIGFYLEDFMRDLNMTRSLANFGYSVALLVAGFTLPFTGKIVDRFGSRRTMFLVSIFYGGSVSAFGIAQNAIALTFCFYFSRVAVNILQLCASVMTNQWWVKRRGVANSCMKSIGQLMLLYPSILIGLNSFLSDWRIDFLVQGLGTFLSIIVMYPFIYDHPEKYGELPDLRRDRWEQKIDQSPSELGEIEKMDTNSGDGATDTNDQGSPPTAEQNLNLKNENFGTSTLPQTPEIETEEEVSWTLREVAKTLLFWVFVFAYSCQSLLWGGFNVNWESILRDHGLPKSYNTFFYLPMMITIVVGILFVGPFFDRVKSKHVLASLASFLASVCYLIAIYLDSVFALVAFGILLGASGSFSNVGMNVVLAHYFGRKNLGTVLAAFTGILNVFTGVGPVLFGLCRDMSGTYTPILLLLGILSAVFSVALVFVKPPKKIS